MTVYEESKDCLVMGCVGRRERWEPEMIIEFLSWDTRDNDHPMENKDSKVSIISVLCLGKMKR